MSHSGNAHYFKISRNPHVHSNGSLYWLVVIIVAHLGELELR